MVKLSKTITISIATSFLFSGLALAQGNIPSQASKGQQRAEEVKTQDNGNEVSAQAKSSSSNSKNENKTNNGQGEEHRSAVANFVLNLLRSADRLPKGIGEEVRKFAQEQSSSSNNVADLIKNVESRNPLKTFLIGSDYKNLGQLRSEIVKTRNSIEQLKSKIDSITAPDLKFEMEDQINSYIQYQTKLENFVKSNESKFSLFGWVSRLLNK